MVLTSSLITGLDMRNEPWPYLRAIKKQTTKQLAKQNTGLLVSRQRVLDILEAQQQGPLSEHRSNLWIEAMLAAAGKFEPTPLELLDSEPNTPMPPLQSQPNPHLER